MDVREAVRRKWAARAPVRRAVSDDDVEVVEVAPKKQKSGFKVDLKGDSKGSLKGNSLGDTRAATSAATEDTANDVCVVGTRELDVVDLTSDTDVSDASFETSDQKSRLESVTGIGTDSSSKPVFESPIKMIRSNLAPQHDSRRVSDMFCENAREVWIFAMQIELAFVVPLVQKQSPQCKITVVGTDILGAQQFPQVHAIAVKKHLQHAKLVLCWHENARFSVSVSTGNFTAVELTCMGNCFWQSGELEQLDTGAADTAADTDVDPDFGTSLAQFLDSFGLDAVSAAARRLPRYDFSGVRADFVYSSPRATHNSGYPSLIAKVRQLDQQVRHSVGHSSHSSHSSHSGHSGHSSPQQPDHHGRLLLVSASSIGAATGSSDDTVADLFTHTLLPGLTGSEYPLAAGAAAVVEYVQRTGTRPVVLFPSTQEVRGNVCGPQIATFLFRGNNKNTQLQERLYSSYNFRRDVTAEAAAAATGGKYLCNHSKIYLASQNYAASKTSVNVTDAEWVYMGSHNLSRAAWGASKPTAQGIIRSRNFEAGVLIHRAHFQNRRLVPVFNSDSVTVNSASASAASAASADVVPVRLPFRLPLLHSDSVFTKR